LLLKSYYNIVRKNVEDFIPKAIMHFLVNHTKRALHNYLITKLYRDDLLEDLLKEPDEITIKRKQIRENLKVLQQAYKVCFRDSNSSIQKSLVPFDLTNTQLFFASHVSSASFRLWTRYHSTRRQLRGVAIPLTLM